MPDVFISYSRRDRGFIDEITAYLDGAQFSYWLDVEDLHPADIWREDLKSAIIESDNLLFAISPDAIDSEHCRMELDFAVSHNKRIIPVVCRDLRENQDLPRALGERQWLPLALEGDGASLEAIGAAIRNDYRWRKTGTDYLRRAENWQSGRGGVLARVELEVAREWLQKGAMMDPGPTEQQIRYIQESDAYHLAEAERWQVLYAKTLARQLAAQSQVLIDKQGVLLEVGALLAVESMRRHPTLEGDRALRKALWLLPKEVARMDPAAGSDYRACAFSPDGRVIAIHGKDNFLRVFDVVSGDIIAERQIDARGDLLICPNRSHLAIVGGMAFIWDWETDREAVRVGVPDVRAAAYSPDGEFFVTSGGDLKTHLWDVDGYEELAWYINAEPMHGVAIATDAREVIAWNTNLAEFFRSPGVADQVMELTVGGRYSFSPDGRRLALTVAGDYTATLFDAHTKEQLIFEERHWHAAFSGNGRYFAVASPEWDAHAYDLDTCNQAGIRMVIDPATAGMKREYIYGRVSCKRGNSVHHDNSVYKVALSHSGRLMATTSRDGTARIWETYRGREILRLVEGTVGGIRKMAFHPDENRVTGWGPSVCRTWEAEGHRQVAAMKHRDGVYGLTFSGDGRRAATISRDGTAGVWTVPDGRQIARIDVDAEQGGYRVALDDEGGRLMVANRLVFEISSGSHMPSPFKELKIAGMSANWRFAALVDGDEIVVVEADRPGADASRATMSAPPKGRVSFNREGDLMAWIAGDGTAWIWPWSSGGEPRSVVPSIQARGCYIDASGQRLGLLDAGDNGLVHIIDPVAGEPVLSIRHEGHVNHMAFDDDARHAAIASKDFSAGVWELEKGIQIASLRHDADVQAVAFSPSGRYVLSAGGRSDRTARLWYWRPEDLIAEACARLERDLTGEEWAHYFGEETYRSTRLPK